MKAPPKRTLPQWLEQCKAVRRYVAANPGKTAEEIHAANPGSVGTIGFLQRRKLIRFEGGGRKGPAKWFVIPQ